MSPAHVITRHIYNYSHGAESWVKVISVTIDLRLWTRYQAATFATRGTIRGTTMDCRTTGYNSTGRLKFIFWWWSSWASAASGRWAGWRGWACRCRGHTGWSPHSRSPPAEIQTFIIIAYFCFNALWKTKVTLHAFVYVLRAAAQRIESCIFISDAIKVSGLEFRETWT